MVRTTVDLDGVTHIPVLALGAIRLAEDACGRGYLQIVQCAAQERLADVVALTWAALRYGWYETHGRTEASFALPGAPGDSPEWLFEALHLGEVERFADGYAWLARTFRMVFGRDERQPDQKAAEGDSGNAPTGTAGSGAPSSASPTVPSDSDPSATSTP